MNDYKLEDHDAHLAPMEGAARIYCAHMDQDPDHMNTIPSAIAGVDRFRPTWLFAAEKLIDLIYMLDSLSNARRSSMSQPIDTALALATLTPCTPTCGS
jgi:hypothetical protein